MLNRNEIKKDAFEIISTTSLSYATKLVVLAPPKKEGKNKWCANVMDQNGEQIKICTLGECLPVGSLLVLGKVSSPKGEKVYKALMSNKVSDIVTSMEREFATFK